MRKTDNNKFVLAKLNFKAVVGFILVASLLQACGNKRLAPVEERQATGKKAQSISAYPQIEVDARTKTYKVQAGDTLYSIAFRYGVDFKTLAKVNAIGRDYLINPGQTLNIEKARHYTETASSKSAQVKPVASKKVVKISRNSTKKPPVKIVTKPKVAQTSSKSVPTKPKTITKKNTKKNPKVVNQDQFSNKQVAFWMWPSVGKIIKTFNNSKGPKGLDIAGNIGQPVRAAATGRVVYAGKGLRGYGNLIIVKHNNDYISAYAHNKVILVKENEIIKAGQKIAEIGNTESDIPKLHFEIRYKGKPVDPIRYLPKR